MLNINNFSNSLLNALDSAGDILSTSRAHSVWADALSDYLKDNLQITGTYFGTCGGGSPDPFNGYHIWSPSSVSFDSSVLMSGASNGGLSGWAKNLSSVVNGGILFKGESNDSLVTCSSSCYPVISFYINKNDFEGGYDKIGLDARDYAILVSITLFVNALKNSSLTPSPATGVGACSTGIITWENLE